MTPPEVWIAFFRGINVGRAKRVPMAGLRTLFAELGFGEVATVVNSGNVIFTGSGVVPAREEGRIREAVLGAFEVDARVTVISGNEFGAIVAENPFGAAATDPARFLVGFLSRDPEGETAPFTRSLVVPLAARDWSPESFVLGPHAAYLWTPPGVADSAVFKEVNRILRDRITTRNWRTVMKILELVRERN